MKIGIGEHCFGSYVSVDDTNLCNDEYVDLELQREGRIKILDELTKNIDNISVYYWKELAEMAMSNNESFEIDEEESFHDTCEQCGNWNNHTTYNKKQ